MTYDAAMSLAMRKADMADRLAEQLDRVGRLAKFGHARNEAVELRLMNGDLRDWADLVMEYQNLKLQCPKCGRPLAFVRDRNFPDGSGKVFMCENGVCESWQLYVYPEL